MAAIGQKPVSLDIRAFGRWRVIVFGRRCAVGSASGAGIRRRIVQSWGSGWVRVAEFWASRSAGRTDAGESDCPAHAELRPLRGVDLRDPSGL